jgi:uncharacterized membrane protein
LLLLSFGAVLLLLLLRQVTKVKLEQKQKEGIAEARSGRRGPVSSNISCGSSAKPTTNDEALS